MTQRWYGQRSSTRADTDFDRAMSTIRLETPPGGFATRDQARHALLKMVANEMTIAITDGHSLDTVKRLADIFVQMGLHPESDSAEVDGLRFAIWPVEQPEDNPDVVTNVSDLTPPMRKLLLLGQIDGTFQIPQFYRRTKDALVRRGYISYLGQFRWKRTEAGERARRAIEAE